jgi:hypothetical protein
LFYMSDILASLTTSQLRQAIQLKEQIEALEKQLATIADGADGASPFVKAKLAVKKRVMSAAGRAKISAAAKKRWAKFNAAKLVAKSAKPAAKAAAAAKPAKKRTMSAAAKAKMSAAAKERWAKAKAAGKKTL